MKTGAGQQSMCAVAQHLGDLPAEPDKDATQFMATSICSPR
jgi:hypothetical protein